MDLGRYNRTEGKARVGVEAAPLRLFDRAVSPLDDVWVALDLETTGLSADEDEIIEVGAVKFEGPRTIDTFQSFVNPRQVLSSFIRRYTGISQQDVDRAPSFRTVARELASFIGRAPVVGHNIAFDLGFLTSSGLRIGNPMCDTWDLAYVLLPEAPAYSLAKLAATLGISHPRPHRATEDALVTRDVFLKLAEMARELDVYTLAEMERLAARSSWVLAYYLRRVETSRVASAQPGSVGASGLDIPMLRERLRRPRALRPDKEVSKLDPGFVASLLTEGGAVATTMDGFEERMEQMAMARAVAEAINEGKRLIVEAGTGVGKSLAYLLPAAVYALANNKRVVVSTNTINLQEQLLTKDVPAVVDALTLVDGVAIEDFRYAQLKGRANYLCLKRWALLRSGESLTDDEARLLSKALVWLRTTATGDRSELNLGRRSVAAPWDRLSAQGAQDCAGLNGVCFLRAAREKAAAAHLVIVNHALLMSDLIAGRALIPEYDLLIVDEAHHLEEEATKHLGFEVGQAGIDDLLQSLGGDRGLMNRVVAAFRGSQAPGERKRAVEETAGRIVGLVPGIRDSVAGMYGVLGGIVAEAAEGVRSNVQQVRITHSTRSQPAWSELEIQWQNVDASLSVLGGELALLSSSLDVLQEAELTDREGVAMETTNDLQRSAELRERLAEFMPHPEPDGIYWVSRVPRTGDLTLHKAPLHVGDKLDKLLFQQKASVVLTGATLSATGSFEHIRERTGFEDAEELLLGSPFDYRRAALLCVPQDMPEPTSWAYQAAVEQAIADATLAVGGRTMALFTSHASLQSAARAIRGTLESAGLDVYAQGIDGPPHRVLESFLENPRSVLLGTASFWEGVDLAGESLKVLLVARLPFSVPTEPVFAARSELYDNPFMEFAVPQAILRIRQGFGRLIRTRTDRGVVVILDRRIVSRRYGRSFIRSLPPVTLKTGKLRDLGEDIHGWIGVQGLG